MNNLSNGLMFGMEGPNMEGTWYNPKTGDSFTVRNSFFQDNQYVVQTTDGRILEYNQLQHYIQSDGPIPSASKESSLSTELPMEVVDIIDNNDEYLLPEDKLLLNRSPKSLGNLNDIEKVNGGEGYSVLEMNDFNIINKALNKKDLPDIQVSVKWDNFPKKEVEMLMDIMEIPIESIIQWYINQINIEHLSFCLNESIKDYIIKKLNINYSSYDLPVNDVKDRKEYTNENVVVEENRKSSKKDVKTDKSPSTPKSTSKKNSKNIKK